MKGPFVSKGMGLGLGAWGLGSIDIFSIGTMGMKGWLEVYAIIVQRFHVNIRSDAQFVESYESDDTSSV